MYIVEPNLRETISFVSGMSLMTDEPNLSHSFSEWICSEKLKIRSAVSWEVLVQTYLKQQGVNPENQVDAFFDLLFEFLEGQNFCSENSS